MNWKVCVHRSVDSAEPGGGSEEEVKLRFLIPTHKTVYLFPRFAIGSKPAQTYVSVSAAWVLSARASGYDDGEIAADFLMSREEVKVLLPHWEVEIEDVSSFIHRSSSVVNSVGEGNSIYGAFDCKSEDGRSQLRVKCVPRPVIGQNTDTRKRLQFVWRVCELDEQLQTTAEPTSHGRNTQTHHLTPLAVCVTIWLWRLVCLGQISRRLEILPEIPT